MLPVSGWSVRRHDQAKAEAASARLYNDWNDSFLGGPPGLEISIWIGASLSCDSAISRSQVFCASLSSISVAPNDQMPAREA